MCRMKLTQANYYSREANEAYMSASQYKSFSRCEAAAMAELRGEWSRGSTQALLVGGYLDAYFSGEMEQYRAEHPEIFKRDGTLKAEYIQAQAAAYRLERDELCRMLLSGRHQIIKTGKIGGVWFKGKFDSLLTSSQVEAIVRRYPAVRDMVPLGGPMIIDLKYMRDFEQVWDPEQGEKVSFVTYWGYDIQGAIYQALDGRQAPFGIVGVTKDAEPDIGAFAVSDGDMEAALLDVEQNASRYAAIKRGEIAPRRCGRCPYCRATKRIDHFTDHRLAGLVAE